MKKETQFLEDLKNLVPMTPVQADIKEVIEDTVLDGNLHIVDFVVNDFIGRLSSPYDRDFCRKISNMLKKYIVGEHAILMFSMN